MAPPVRLRQVAVITRDLAAAADRVESDLGLHDPYADPGVAEFGLENRVYAAGETFLEILTPIAEATAGGRHLDRHGDSGYMAIFQVDDRAAAEARVDELGVRVVFRADLDDIGTIHLHPSDVGGAIVSLDWADPPGSWRWAGPTWTGRAPAGSTGGISALTVAAVDPDVTAATWHDLLGPGARRDGRDLVLDAAAQVISFVDAPDRAAEGIVACRLALPGSESAGIETTIAGVRFEVAQ